MGTYVEITEQQMDDLLKSEKGWQKNQAGYEYVYDYHLSKYPIIVKVMSSISVVNATGRNKGQDAIRIFAVRKNEDGDVVGGLLKTRRVYRTNGWQKRVFETVVKAIKDAKQVYDRKWRES